MVMCVRSLYRNIHRLSIFSVYTILIVFSLMVAFSLSSFAERKTTADNGTPPSTTVKKINNLERKNGNWITPFMDPMVRKVGVIPSNYLNAMDSFVNGDPTQVGLPVLKQMGQDGYVGTSEQVDTAGIFDSQGKLVGGFGQRTEQTKLAPQKDGRIAKSTLNSTEGSYNNQASDYAATSSPTYGLRSGWNPNTGLLEYINADGKFSGKAYTGYTTAGGDNFYYKDGRPDFQKTLSQYASDINAGRKVPEGLQQTLDNNKLSYKRETEITNKIEEDKKGNSELGEMAATNENLNKSKGQPVDQPFTQNTTSPTGKRTTATVGYEPNSLLGGLNAANAAANTANTTTTPTAATDTSTNTPATVSAPAVPSSSSSAAAAPATSTDTTPTTVAPQAETATSTTT